MLHVTAYGLPAVTRLAPARAVHRWPSGKGRYCSSFDVEGSHPVGVVLVPTGDAAKGPPAARTVLRARVLHSGQV